MLASKTVFVIGAGASAEAGLPVGDELKTIISNKLDYRHDQFHRLDPHYGDTPVHDALRQSGGDFTKKIRACAAISNGLAASLSIDNFIDTHRHDRLIAECGKLAITCSILEAERKSSLFVSPSNTYNQMDFRPLANTWYMGFWLWIQQGVYKPNLDSIFDNVAIVSFNYDRCLQHFLAHAICNNYQVTLDEAKKTVEKLRIYFPYGSVGSYLGVHKNYVPFGSEHVPRYESIQDGLKTYTEQIEDSESLIAMRNAVADANPIIFLGNHYHDTNINLLCGGKHTGNVSKAIYGTRKGIFSDDDLNVIKAKLDKTSSRSGLASFRFSETCADLFKEYGRSMRGT